MSEREVFSSEAWSVLEAAKVLALAEGAHEIQTQHIFRACGSHTPELLTRIVERVQLPAAQAERFLKAASLAMPTGPAVGGSMKLSRGANDVVVRAKDLARERPEQGSSRVETVHILASACMAFAEIRDWLRGNHWEDQHVRRLCDAAHALLPARCHPALTEIGEDEREILNRYCPRDLTALARAGRIDKAYGMGGTRAQMDRCLLRRDRRSLVLTGNAGVGKTKLVEDLACRIVAGEAPGLTGCEVFELDLAAFTRGTHLAGSRAERWAQLSGVLRAHAERIILFIDELHTIMGLPIEGQASDLANFMKPLLVDDKVRIVGATTNDEYRRHIEGDPALARRFTEVKVQEPDRDSMLRLLTAVASGYERFHGVRYTPEAIESIYHLAQLYLPNQAFPSKGVDLLDEVGVHVRVANGDVTGQAKTVAKVAPEDVRDVFRRVWGIEPAPVTANIASLLKARVIGQDHACDRLADAVLASSMRFGQEQQAGPRGCFLFLGPPGVGKTYMARVLSDILFPGRQTMLSLDMTEFAGDHSGEHAQWRLLGAPAPYVGWENGGVLTRHVLEHPMSVVLVDELDKAGPEARNVLLRILNEGYAKDGRGRMVSFRGVYFVITANGGRRLWEKRTNSIGFFTTSGTERDGASIDDSNLREELAREGFAPELLSRMGHVVAFNALTVTDVVRVTSLALRAYRDAALVEGSLILEYDEARLATWLAERAEPAGDVRGVRRALERFVEIPLARWRCAASERTASPMALRLDAVDDALKISSFATVGNDSTVEQRLLKHVVGTFVDSTAVAVTGADTVVAPAN